MGLYNMMLLATNMSAHTFSIFFTMRLLFSFKDESKKNYPQCTPVITTDIKFLLTYYDQYFFLSIFFSVCTI